MTNPKVSVLMSVYNGERHLSEAIDSILSQTFKDFEFIIIDDGSIDGIWEILTIYAKRDPRIVLIRNDNNVGLTRSLNKGLMVAKGEYIARQDADDISLSERLAVQVEYLNSHSNIGLLGTAYYVVKSQGEHTDIHRQPLTDTGIRWQMLFHNAFCHTSVMFRRGLLCEGKHLYDDSLPYSQDYDFWARLLQYTSAANLDKPLVALRLHDGTISVTQREKQQQIASLIAMKQIKALVPQFSFSESEVSVLRLWYYEFPDRLNRKDIELCKMLLQILNAFGKQQDIDRDLVYDIRRQLISRIQGAVSAKRLWTSGLLYLILHNSITLALTCIPERIARITKKVFRLDKNYGHA